MRKSIISAVALMASVLTLSGCEKEEDKPLVEIKKGSDAISVNINKEKLDDIDESISNSLDEVQDKLDVEVNEEQPAEVNEEQPAEVEDVLDVEVIDEQPGEVEDVLDVEVTDDASE